MTYNVFGMTLNLTQAHISCTYLIYAFLVTDLSSSSASCIRASIRICDCVITLSGWSKNFGARVNYRNPHCAHFTRTQSECPNCRTVSSIIRSW